MDTLHTFEVRLGSETFSVDLLRAMPGDPDVVRALIDIDLQTYAESTFSEHSAWSFVEHGAVYLVRRSALPDAGRGAEHALIGFCVCLRDFFHPTHALLLTMGILPGWRGRGLGQHLVGAVLDDLRRAGFDAVVLHVGARNQRAVRVYRDVGFDVIAEAIDPADGDRRLTLRADLHVAHREE